MNQLEVHLQHGQVLSLMLLTQRAEQEVVVVVLSVCLSVCQLCSDFKDY